MRAREKDMTIPPRGLFYLLRERDAAPVCAHLPGIRTIDDFSKKLFIEVKMVRVGFDPEIFQKVVLVVFVKRSQTVFRFCPYDD